MNSPHAEHAHLDVQASGDLAARHFRQILLWPLRLMPLVRPGSPPQPHRTPWQISGRFHERHYNEFVTFLPYVQRFLYGDGRGGKQARSRDADAPMRGFRREDIAKVRVQARSDAEPFTLEVVHANLYFFFDVDVVLLNVELGASDLSLAQAQEQLYRFGRGYPAGWDVHGQALHSMANVEWLDAAGNVLSSSDAQQRELFMAHVAEHLCTARSRSASPT